MAFYTRYDFHRRPWSYIFRNWSRLSTPTRKISLSFTRSSYMHVPVRVLSISLIDYYSLGHIESYKQYIVFIWANWSMLCTILGFNSWLLCHSFTTSISKQYLNWCPVETDNVVNWSDNTQKAPWLLEGSMERNWYPENRKSFGVFLKYLKFQK